MNMKNEIGSEFWDVPASKKTNSLFPKNTKWFLSGRHALEYIVIDSGIKSVSMPKWCCESMINPLKKHGIYIDYYDVEPNYSYDAVLIMDYFGFANKRYNKPACYRGIVIRDLTHSLFSMHYNDSDYYFGSLRKWAGFYTGGYAWGRWKKHVQIPPHNEKYVTLRKTAMALKKAYINDGEGDKKYLIIYKEANDMLDNIDISASYPIDIDKAKHLDVEFIKNKRRKNAQTLINELQLDIDLNDNDVPLFVPIFINNRNELRKFLAENDVYCPAHWPNYDFNGTELSLICDQRYDEKDMLRIANLIKIFKEYNK